jgi:hypothetical protein
MAKPGTINQTAINSTIINGERHSITINFATIAINVNKSTNTLINDNAFNISVINGLIVSNQVRVSQTHVLQIDSASIALQSTVPTPVMVFTFTPANASISVIAKKVFITKGQGGNIFVTITEPNATVHRFSFEGIKA